MAKHYIELARIDDAVAMTLRSGVDQSSYTRNIGVNDAFDLGIIMGGDRPEERALCFETNSGVSLQIENQPYDCAWLRMERDGGDLVVCIEREGIDQLGQSFWKLARGKRDPKVDAAFSHCVDFYRETEVDGDDAPADRSHLL